MSSIAPSASVVSTESLVRPAAKPHTSKPLVRHAQRMVNGLVAGSINEPLF